MTNHTKQRLEMFVRVRQFGEEHRELFPESSIGGKLFATVAAAAAQIEAHASARLRAADEGQKARGLKRRAIQAQLQAIVRTARAVDRTAPGFKQRFKWPTQQSDIALLTTARAFIDAGADAHHQLVAFGLPETFAADLQQLVDRLSQSKAGRQTSKTDRKALQHRIGTAIAEGFEAVRLLDGIVPNSLTNHSDLAAVWPDIRRVGTSGRTAAASVDGTEPAEAPPKSAVPDAPQAATPDALSKAS